MIGTLSQHLLRDAHSSAPLPHYLLDFVADHTGDGDELELDDRLLPTTPVVELYQLSTQTDLLSPSMNNSAIRFGTFIPIQQLKFIIIRFILFII